MSLTSNSLPECPSCRGKAVSFCGELPVAHYFAGQKLGHPLPRSSLYSCRNCALYFRYPALSAAELDKIYAHASTHAWTYIGDQRVDWQLTQQFFEQSSIHGKILDVGCYDGQFLSQLTGNYERFGLEINTEAVNKAAKSGVQIIGRRVDEIPRQFLAKAITAFDVIEHIQDPLAFITHLSAATELNGYIVIASGSASSPSFNFMGSRYWYCSLPEHISFISEEWCRNAAQKLNLTIQKMSRYSHSGDSLLRPLASLCQCATNLPFKVAPNLSTTLKQSAMRLIKGSGHVTGGYMSWDAAKDHIWCVFQKRAP